MRKFLVIIFLVIGGANLNAQYKLSDNIWVKKGNFGATKIYINADSDNKYTSVVVSQNKIEKIHELLLQIKSRFKDWQEVAIRDSVEYVKKEFKRDFLFYAGVNWNNGGQVWGNYGIMMIPYFIVENGKGWLSIRLYRSITDSSNRFIVLRDFSWNFYSVEDIDNFIATTQKENIQKALQKGAYDNDLFK